MPRKKEVLNAIHDELYSVQRYDPNIPMEDYAQGSMFDKWAAIEVSNYENIPAEMTSIEQDSGLYAVFNYKHSPTEAAFFFDTFLLDGCRHPDINWTTEHILKSEVINLKWVMRILRKKFGCLSNHLIPILSSK